MFIEATKLDKSFDDNVILDNASFTVSPGARIGLVGKNGSGKTTLLKMIQGLVSYEDGNLHIKKGITIAYVPQVPDITDTQTVREFLLNYSERIHKIEEVLASLRVGGILDMQFGSLSGGQKTKVYLARIALYDADVLLLDEPTNHLDLQGLRWLEEYLRRFKGAFVVISHDRFFLDKTVTEIIELEGGVIQNYGGNYSSFREQKQIQQDAHVHSYESQQKEIKRLRQSVRSQRDEGNRKNHNRVNTRDNDKYTAHYFADRSSNKLHNAAKGIESRISQVEMIEKPEKDSVLDLYFKPSGAQNSNVITVTDMEIGYDSILFNIDSMSVNYGNRIALQGENGSGKTTLISKILQHQDHSEISVGPGVKIGYLSQDHSELDEGKTAFQLLTSIDGVDATAAYKILSQINILPDQMKQSLGEFSSGQKTKLLLAVIMASGSNCIILDEPTNHLDFQSIDVIERALSDFKGTILCVSHDRYFLDQIGITKYMTIEEGVLRHLQKQD